MEQLNTYTKEDLEEALRVFDKQTSFMQGLMQAACGEITLYVVESKKLVRTAIFRRTKLSVFTANGIGYETVIKLAVAKGFFNVYWISKAYKYIVFADELSKDVETAMLICKAVEEDSSASREVRNKSQRKWHAKNKQKRNAKSREYKARKKLEKESISAANDTKTDTTELA